MLKEQKNNKIIGIIVILVVFGALFYIKMSKQSDIPENNTPEEQSEVVEQESVSGEVEGKIQNPTTNIVVKNDGKFNSLLEAGNKAFYAKDYSDAIRIFKEALVIQESDFVYARLHSVYAAMGDKVQAIKMIDKAINKNPLFTEHWITKLVYLEEKTETAFSELKQIYIDGLSKVDSRTKPNLVTTFARIAESNSMKDDAIAAWTKAIEIYPANKSIYQAEIDRLKSN